MQAAAKSLTSALPKVDGRVFGAERERPCPGAPLGSVPFGRKTIGLHGASSGRVDARSSKRAR
eukprot:739435-Pyramimonas_sp.AAC.1